MIIFRHLQGAFKCAPSELWHPGMVLETPDKAPGDKNKMHEKSANPRCVLTLGMQL